MSEPRKNRRESRRALVISIAIHGVVGTALVEVLLLPSPLRTWLHLGGTHAAPPVEHLQYVAEPQRSVAAAAPRAPQPAPAPAAELSAPRTPLVAPPSVPLTLPPAPATPAKPETPAVTTGPVASIGGPAHGARPEYYGPQVWVGSAPPGRSAESPKTDAERVDSVAKAIIGHEIDSLALVGPHRQPGDWTVEHNGKKYGIDQRFIHLGPIEIPTAILALLPLNNLTGNPIAAQNERLLTARYNDIQYQANRAINEDMMNKAIKEERLRKQREHDEKQKQQPKSSPPEQQSAPVAAAQQ